MHSAAATPFTLAVGFDLDHTLGIDNRLEWTVLSNLLRTRVPQLSHVDIGDHVSAALSEYREHGVALDAALTHLFERMRIAGTATQFIQTFRQTTLAEVRRHMRPLGGVVATLGRLQSLGVRTAVLTNGWNPLQQAKLDAMGIRVPLVVSDDVGARKPDPRAFAALRSALGPADEVWFVGDDPFGDVDGARKAGFRTIWFDEGTHWPSNVARADHEVRILAQIPRIIEDRLREAAATTRDDNDPAA